MSQRFSQFMLNLLTLKDKRNNNKKTKNIVALLVRHNYMTMFLDNCWMAEVFVISGIIKVEVSVISLAQRS